MNCFTHFILSSKSGEIPHDHKKNDCKETLKLMESLNYTSKDQYLSRVIIQKKYGFFDIYNQSFDLLSHKQFQCLLKCTEHVKKNNHLACEKKCFEKVDEIWLNSFDGPAIMLWEKGKRFTILVVEDD